MRFSPFWRSSQIFSSGHLDVGHIKEEFIVLVLSRQCGEVLVVGPIRVKVVRISPNAVRIGIEAPDDMKILREELLEPGETGNEPRE